MLQGMLDGMSRRLNPRSTQSSVSKPLPALALCRRIRRCCSMLLRGAGAWSSVCVSVGVRCLSWLFPQEEAAMLRRALAESGRQLRAATSDAGAMVDRRVVTKLLLTYFERGRDQDMLNLMARMLGFSGARTPRPEFGAARPRVCNPGARHHALHRHAS